MSNENKLELNISVELSPGEKFKESIENCMKLFEEIQKEHSCNCTLNVQVLN